MVPLNTVVETQKSVEDVVLNAVNEATDIIPQVVTMADADLDAASLAAERIGAAEKLTDPNQAGAEILSLKDRVAELEEVVKDMPAIIKALNTLSSNSPDYAGLRAAVDDVVKAIPELDKILPRIEQLEADLPAVKNVVDEIESALPNDWKAHLGALLAHTKQYFGI